MNPLRNIRARAATAGTLVLLLGLGAACTRDDGATVRNVTPGDSGGSARGSGSASGSGSGSASGSASGSGAAGPGGEICRPVGDASSATTRVLVKLDEFYVRPADPSAPAGRINFHIENAGAEPHELVVVKGTDPAGLPTDDAGKVLEDQLPPDAFVGEVEPFPGNSGTCDGTFDLTAGSYVLFCNIVDMEEDGTTESHYREGMRAGFTVT